MVKPDRDQGERRPGRPQPGSRRAELPARLSAAAGDGRHQQVRRRREPRPHPGLGRAADRRVRADPVRAADRDGARGPAAVRAADDQQVLRARSRAGAEHGRVAGAPGPAGVRDLVAQPGRRAGPLRSGHLRRGGARGARRGRGHHGPAGGAPQRRVLGRDHQRRRPRSSGRRRASGRGRQPDPDGGRAGQRAAGTAAALVGRETAAAAVADSARRGYLDGQALAGVFTWLRPNDLVWNYVVNNYLLGKDPPAFDVLFWNQDTVRLAAGLHRDFIHVALEQLARAPGSARSARDAGGPGRGRRRQLHRRRARPTTSSRGRTPTAAPSCSAASRDSCSRPAATSRRWSTRPPTRAARATGSPRRIRCSPEAWSERAATRRGSWWPDYDEWLAARSGELKPAPKRLGGPDYRALGKAPGTYVHAS